MKSLVFGIAAAGLILAGTSLAQTPPGTGPTATPASPQRPAATTDPAATTPRPNDAAAASGNNNQAVATTSANASAPAKGANSFTAGEAKSRLEKNGFSDVSGLAKDDNGVWRGSAQKGGAATTVWLDYKGNTGEGK